MPLQSQQVFGTHAAALQPPAFSPDGLRVVAGDQAGGLVLYERHSPEPEAPFSVAAKVRVPQTSAPRTEVLSVSWSPCGFHLACLVTGALLLFRGGDLTPAGPRADHVGRGPLALGGDGTWIAVLGEGSAALLDFPSLENRRYHPFYRGGFEYFRTLALAADPRGSLLAVSDDGGQDETAMGMVLNRGTPQVTLIDVERREAVGAIEVGQYVRRLAFDSWRDRIVTAGFHEKVLWVRDGTPANGLRFTARRLVAVSVTGVGRDSPSPPVVNSDEGHVKPDAPWFMPAPEARANSDSRACSVTSTRPVAPARWKYADAATRSRRTGTVATPVGIANRAHPNGWARRA